MNELGFQTLFEQIPLSIILMEGDIIVRLNPAASRRIGNHLIGHPLSDLMPAKESELLLQSAAEGKGTVLYGLAVADAYYDIQSGCLEGLVWLALYPQRSSSASRGLNFIEGMSALGGQIRAPLTLMMSAISLLASRMDTAQDKKSEQYLAALSQNCFRLLRLSNNLMEFPRFQAGAVSLFLQERNLCSFVQEIADSVVPFAAVRGVTLQVECAEAPLMLAFDDQKLERLLLNLLSNALGGMSEGGRITVSVSANEEYAYLRVSDTGKGIPPDRLMQLFSVRLSYAPDDPPGLGLPIVRMIAELHGGALMLESRMGVGTSVTASLRRGKVPTGLLRARPVGYDYTGEFSHALVELSDAVPNGTLLYHPAALR